MENTEATAKTITCEGDLQSFVTKLRKKTEKEMEDQIRIIVSSIKGAIQTKLKELFSDTAKAYSLYMETYQFSFFFNFDEFFSFNSVETMKSTFKFKLWTDVCERLQEENIKCETSSLYFKVTMNL